jgi:AraC-like DNA-binding protein
MGFYKKAQGHAMLRDKHDDYLLIYCVSGEGLLTLNNKSIKIGSGDLIVLPRSVLHEYAAKKKTPWSIYWVHCEGSLAHHYITQLSKPEGAKVLSIGLHSRLITDFEALLDTRLSNSLFESHLHSCSLLRQIITYIVLLYKQTQHQSDKSFNLESVKSMMLTHIHQQLDIDTLANTANLSKFHFIKRYKTLTGRTPINDFIQMKIERACHLLDISDKSIATIGLELGYEDAYYFSRVFNKIMGISPTQYRTMRLSHA